MSQIHQSKLYRTRDRAFEYGYIARASDMTGRMEPKFRPHWWAQLLSDGTMQTFDTKAECLAWIRGWSHD